MHLNLPVLSLFLFISLHLFAKLYAVFLLEPMHVFILCLGRTLNKCLKAMLNDFSIILSAIKKLSATK